MNLIGLFWNTRGFNRLGRSIAVSNAIKENKVDFIGIQETKKEVFAEHVLRNLTTPTKFCWEYLPAKGTARGILIGIRNETL